MPSENMPELKLDFLGDLRRTHNCGALRASDAGRTALLMGWVHRRRDLGGVIFIHLRDRYGVTQVVFDQSKNRTAHERAQELSTEFVIAVEGLVTLRAPETVNPNITLRSQITFAIRQALYEQGFLEIETPFLTRSTPEGARDFLVPSRVQPGCFYALPQSPQLFKQLLMVAGCERYFQIVRCFRDEDLRADRQPEFTQIDLEMSFPQQEQIFEVIEPLIQRVCEAAGKPAPGKIPRMSYAEAMRCYGSDKPDLRLPPFHCVQDLFAGTNLLVKDLPLVAIHIPKTGVLSRKERDEIKATGQERGLRVYDDLKRLERDFAANMMQLRERVRPAEDDLLILATANGECKGARPEQAVLEACGQLRLQLAQRYNDRHKLLNSGDLRFLWVTDFPMFES